MPLPPYFLEVILILLQEFGIEVRHLFREWERLWLRSSDYKNHRIFSLRCLHKDLIPVSIKLKSTLDTSKARQIIRKAEKDLLQARIKAINNILVQVDRQIEECRAKLASIILAERLGECQDFINKVSEFRFNKVRQRQINKLNHLVSKKEGNITIANAVNNITNSGNRQAPCTPTLAIALLPPREGSNSPLATGHLLPEGTVLPQANNQIIGSHPTLARAHLPPGEGSNSPPATVHPPSEGNSSPNNQASGRSYSSNCSPSSWGRKQFSPGSCSPSFGRCQLFPGHCFPSIRGRKQFLPGYFSPSTQGEKQLPPIL